VATRQEEHLSLDFKTVAGSELKSTDDKKNLASALSGFANSAGGIIVWGVATTKNTTGQDVANELKPISDVAAFVNRLEEATRSPSSSRAARGDQPVPSCTVSYAAASLNSPMGEDALDIPALSVAQIVGRSVEPTER